MSKLLIDDYPLMVLPQLAVVIGLNEAIFLQQLHYWLSKDNSIEKDGQNWSFHTYEKWLNQFPFWSLRTLKRIVDNLKKNNLLLVEQLNAHKNDQTNWYSINYIQLTLIQNRIKIIDKEGQESRETRECQNGTLERAINSESAKMARSRECQNGTLGSAKMARCIEKETKQNRDLKKQQHVVAEKKIENSPDSGFSQIRALSKEARELDIPQYMLNDLIDRYGIDVVVQKMEILKKQRGVINRAGWIKAALSKDFQRVESVNANEPLRGTPDCEETQAYLARQVTVSTIHSEDKRKILQDMKKLINGIRPR